MIPAAVDNLVNSLYFNSAPNFLANTNFPAIGYPNRTKTSTIPALTRAQESKKTVDYSFDVDLGPKFYQMDVRNIDLGILITWQTNLLDECETYSIHRKEDSKEPVRIASIKCDNKDQLAEFSFKDYHYNTKSTFASYQVVYHDFFGEEVASNEVQIQLNGGKVSIGSDGLGTLFFPTAITHVKVLNLNGSVVHEKAVRSKIHTLPSYLINGTYIVEYSGNGVHNRSKIRIQR